MRFGGRGGVVVYREQVPNQSVSQDLSVGGGGEVCVFAMDSVTWPLCGGGVAVYRK